MAKIVISYRRADSEGLSGRIRDRLVTHYGADAIFMDIDSIPLGTDFRAFIKSVLEETDIVLAVIGHQWAGVDRDGNARIMDDGDYVRIEIETALARGVPVIPVLLDNAVIPPPSELPESLKELPFRHAAYVASGRDFHVHVDRLTRALDRLLGRVEQQRADAPNGVGGGSDQAAAPLQIAAMAPLAKPRSRGWGPWIGVAAGLLAGVGLMYPLTKYQVRMQIQFSQTIPSSAPAPPPETAPQTKPTPLPPASPNPPRTSPPVAPQTVSTLPPPCHPQATVAFQDSFSPPAPGWDDTSASRLFENGAMVIRIGMDRLQTWLFRSLRFKNISVCADVISPLRANQMNGAASGGIVFLATDYQNYYLAQVYLDGSYQVYRRLGSEWVPLIQRTNSEHVKAGFGVINALQVTVKDTKAAFYANGEKLTEFTVQPPPNGGAVGVHGEAEKDRESEWRFTGITVIDETAPAPRPPSGKATRFAVANAECKSNSDAAFADDFKKADSGWGEATATAFYEGGLMVLKPQPNRTRTMLYRALRYVNPTVCINVMFPTDATEGTGIGAGGIAFWATDYSNFYQASVYRDGTYDVYRYVNAEWVVVMRKTAAPSIKKEPDALNQLKVRLVNNKATLFINGVNVLEFWGQPPATGGSVGLFAQADKERTNSWRFTDIVVVD